MIKWTLKIVFATLLAMLLLICMLQIDDGLDSKLQRILTTNITDSESNSYFYLLGFNASAQDDPISAGKRVFSGIKQQEVANRTRPGSQQQINDTPLVGLGSIDSNLLCRYQDIHCLNTIFSNIDKIPALMTKHALYITRFQQYASFTDFHTLTKPTVTEPLPDYFPIVNAVRLISLAQIYHATHGQAQRAIDRLFVLHTQLRGQLVQQDTLIGKLFSLSLLSENIDLIYLLSKQNPHLSTPIMSPLTAQERNLVPAIHREIIMMDHVFQLLDKAPDIFYEVGQVDGFQSPAWLTRLLYKPNMTSNQGYKAIDYFAQLSVLDINDFSDALLSPSLVPKVESHWLRNPVGSVLTQLAGADYAGYVSRFWSLNNKINLFNAGGTNDAKFEQVVNVFPTLQQERAFYKHNKQQVCLNSPFDDAMQYHCLRIKLLLKAPDQSSLTY